MMRNFNNVIKKNDYERYEIIIPFLSAAGKRRKQFLNSELEKLHPCFSDEFAFDSNIKKIKRSGLCSDVYVVNKYKLAEYERNRSLSGTGLFVEMNQNKRQWQRKRLFVDKKWKLTYSTVCVCTLLAATGIFFGLNTGRTIGEEANDKTSDEELVKETIREASNQSGLIDDRKVSIEESFFNSIAEADGKISWFEWSVKGYTQNLSASVSGIYPENLMDGGGDSVVYENGIPKMKVSYTKHFSIEENTVGKSVLSNSDFNKLLRKTLSEKGAKLLEEKAPPYHIEFLYKPLIGTENLLEELSRIISADRRCVTFVSVHQTDSYDLRIGLSIETIPLTGFDLKLVSENLKLFIDESKRKAASKNETQSIRNEKIAVENSKQEREPLIRIGEIKHSDKTSTVFFKDSKGKVKRILQKEDER